MSTTIQKTTSGNTEAVSVEWSDSKKQLDQQQARQLAAEYDPNSPEERKLVRKLDWRLVVSFVPPQRFPEHARLPTDRDTPPSFPLLKPSTWALYLLSNVDRANIGNAKSGGMAEDFHLSSTQYSVIVLVFFTTYVVCEIPSNMLLNRFRPSLYLPTLAILWGIVAACQGAATNSNQLIGLRLVIGMFESGFAPGCAFYLSSW